MQIDLINQEISLVIRARYPIIYLITWEEMRARRALVDIARSLKKHIYFWSCSEAFEGKLGSAAASVSDPLGALSMVASSPERAIFVFKDFHPYLDDFKIIRRLRDIVYILRKSYKTLILLSPVLKMPLELEKEIVVYDFPLPDKEELENLLKKFLSEVSTSPELKIESDDELVERVINASLGLTQSEAESVFAKVLVRDKKFTLDDLPLIIAEKKQIIRKSGFLEYFDLSETIESVGGLGYLKNWLSKRAYAFSAKAREYGLPHPKGLLLLGVQGCGKSLTAKAIASLWKLPLLRLDVGSVFNPFIGASEENMRRAIKIAESLAPTVLWLDEVEKGFGAYFSSGERDGGTSSRVLATFLTWLQEKTKPVFVIATCNNIDDLPPEMLRKGRFDEIFFIDLPDYGERKEIFKIHFKKRKREPLKFDLDKLSQMCGGFSGAEIEEIIISAMYNSFPENRDITTEDIINCIRETIPLSKIMSEKIESLRQWAKDRARPASPRT